MSGSEKGMMGRSSAGTMTFWVIMLGNPEVDDVFLNTPSPRTGSGADKRGTPTLRGGARTTAKAAVAGSGGGPVCRFLERMRRWCDGE
jgi:hypothetical protein